MRKPFLTISRPVHYKSHYNRKIVLNNTIGSAFKTNWIQNIHFLNSEL